MSQGMSRSHLSNSVVLNTLTTHFQVRVQTQKTMEHREVKVFTPQQLGRTLTTHFP